VGNPAVLGIRAQEEKSRKTPLGGQIENGKRGSQGISIREGSKK